MEFGVKLRYRLISTVLGVCLSLPTQVFAHSGGTNSDGCHNDNINGGYHCHNSKSSSSSGGSEILIAALVVGAAYWYYTTLEPSSNNSYKLDEPNKLKDRFKFSFKPTSMTELDGVSLQMSYAF
jgi:hypothetical protein